MSSHRSLGGRTVYARSCRLPGQLPRAATSRSLGQQTVTLPPPRASDGTQPRASETHETPLDRDASAAKAPAPERSRPGSAMGRSWSAACTERPGPVAAPPLGCVLLLQVPQEEETIGLQNAFSALELPPGPEPDPRPGSGGSPRASPRCPMALPPTGVRREAPHLRPAGTPDRPGPLSASVSSTHPVPSSLPGHQPPRGGW